ncbi:uncharacterized protein AMSG_07504 [Thecamonas trahens ATCC 50062]|uniref:FAM192A/Fyv6 N-terminal domain-containing protein n=1 Tax=Thecamonas trahens ATCC 50062 TaxID=461836 RepID=A0A0L0DHM1_THETB|nr:hypothetical protein AMSG_07504 [Thecamonas trahens ATCC 50062]KNC51596.1 hypothetical protein AMSG_07504 [Thecamonas trahens ATCC 50062]|eukprot:XP_013755994.1 hypothetical protein AMSG_07504 [Thecamonas trahens ATCC 50062]
MASLRFVSEAELREEEAAGKKPVAASGPRQSLYAQLQAQQEAKDAEWAEKHGPSTDIPQYDDDDIAWWNETVRLRSAAERQRADDEADAVARFKAAQKDQVIVALADDDDDGNNDDDGSKGKSEAGEAATSSSASLPLSGNAAASTVPAASPAAPLGLAPRFQLRVKRKRDADKAELDPAPAALPPPSSQPPPKRARPNPSLSALIGFGSDDSDSDSDSDAAA